LKQFYAFEGLLFGWLIGFHCKVNVLESLTDVFKGKSAFGCWMDTFLYDDFDDVASHVVLLEFSFLVGDLKFASLENNFDDLFFGFTGEELVEVSLLGNSAVGGVFIDFFSLKDFRDVLFDTVSPIEGLVTVTGDFEVFFVDVVTDGGNVGEFDVGNGLFEHGNESNSFIMMLIINLL
jgi:hypothetical protein